MLVVRETIFARLTTKQIVMKKAKYLFKLERFVLKSGKTENQQFPGTPPNIGNLFAISYSLALELRTLK